MASSSAVDRFADGTDFSDETINKNRNLYYQQQLATAASQELSQATSLLTSMLNAHLNVGQNFTLNTPQVIMSVQPLSPQSLTSNQSLSSNGITLPASALTNTTDLPTASTVSLQVSFPFSLHHHRLCLFKSQITPLASHGNSQSTTSSASTATTNTSRSVSLTLLDANGQELPLVLSNDTHEKIEIRIPRDPSLSLPAMSYENVTALNNDTVHQLIFNLHYINITSQLPISVHLEMRPINITLSYLLIYRFDQSPQLNTSIQNIDGWTLFCSQSEISPQELIDDYDSLQI